MKILVVEDDAETSAYLVNGLQEEGHLVDQAGNGRDGLFLAVSGQYDVMVVDRMLPALDGLGIVKAAPIAGGTRVRLLIALRPEFVQTVMDAIMRCVGAGEFGPASSRVEA